MKFLEQLELCIKKFYNKKDNGTKMETINNKQNIKRNTHCYRIYFKEAEIRDGVFARDGKLLK